MELLATTGDAFVRVGARTCLQGSGAHCLALDGDTVYVGCRGGGLKRSADGGDSFEDLPLPEADVFSVAVSAADRAVYAGTCGGAGGLLTYGRVTGPALAGVPSWMLSISTSSAHGRVRARRRARRRRHRKSGPGRK